MLFASDAPLSAADISRVDERLDEDTVEAVIQELRAEYELSERSFQIYEVAGGFQLLTRPEFVSVLERYDTVPQPSRLSAPALEVLAIIAYRQPLGRAEIEDIRGVGSSGVLRTLTERGVVEPVGRSEGLGRPLLYGTTKKFLEHFGFRSLEDLPRPDELPVVLRDRTPAAPEAPADDGAPSDDAVALAAASEAQAAPEIAQDATQEPVPDAAPEPAEDATSDPARDAASEPAQDATSEAAPGAASDRAPDAAAEPDAGQEPALADGDAITADGVTPQSAPESADVVTDGDAVADDAGAVRPA
ncbi:MAG TPA: SMC-Scp complex subunit ScpB [Longimicrobiales bacterium]|nr:SMC-Scp complex subunit ScpB [Longimicrobiales bacterium]